MIAEALASRGEHEGVGAHGARGEEVVLEAGGSHQAGQQGQGQEHLHGLCGTFAKVHRSFSLPCIYSAGS